MAHSLKTPIAVIQGIVNKIAPDDKKIAVEQLLTINNIVEYQLQRAATVGKLQLSHEISLKPIVSKIVDSLQKVYIDKNLSVQINIPDETTIKIDQGDLYELLGNLFENAFKWSNSNIIVSAKTSNNQIQITIEDDGPGINESEKERIILRGQRADQNTPGHGIGLAIVSDILLMYKGTLDIAKSETGGAKITVTI
jgi:two-component system sensor histidine kinase PhoQ